MTLFAKDVPKRCWAALGNGFVQLPVFQNALDFVAQMAHLTDTDQITFDVGHENWHPLVGKILGQALQADGFASSSGAGDEAMAVGHAHQNVAICGLIAGN
jgi:hypothetical protein